MTSTRGLKVSRTLVTSSAFLTGTWVRRTLNLFLTTGMGVLATSGVGCWETGWLRKSLKIFYFLSSVMNPGANPTIVSNNA
jgi:hypothetical protein